MACFDAWSVPLRCITWPPSRSTQRRASALAFSSSWRRAAARVLENAKPPPTTTSSNTINSTVEVTATSRHRGHVDPVNGDVSAVVPGSLVPTWLFAHLWIPVTGSRMVSTLRVPA